MDEPIRVSWSMIRAHGECRQRTALLRAGKRAKSGNLRMYFHGMVVDSVMREWLADPNRARRDMRTMVDSHIEQGMQDAIATGDGVVRWRGADDRESLRQFALELVTRLEPILQELVLPHTYICGHRFTHPLTLGDGTKVVLVGEMDLFITGVPLAIWDLKGTKDNNYWRKVLGQLTFYDLACKLETGSYAEKVGLIQPMCKEPVLTFTLDDDVRREMLVRILKYVDDVKRARDDCTPDTGPCRFCEVSHACPRYAARPGTNTLSLSASLRQAAQDTT